MTAVKSVTFNFELEELKEWANAFAKIPSVRS